MSTHITEELIEFALGTTWEQLAPPTREAVSTTTGNILTLAAAGADHPAVDRAAAALTRLDSGTHAPVLGRCERLEPMWAALLHGIAAHVEDYDDTHPPTLVHPGAAIVPAALAGAQISGADGRQMLTSVAVGTEVALRLGLVLTPHAMERSWHMTGIVGVVGAAVAAGRALGLSPRQLRHALGFAATQTAGLLEALGTMAKPLHPGKAASSGVEAALLARAGLDGPRAPLEGRRGLLALLRPGLDGVSDSDAAVLTDGLGAIWELESNEVKPYACGVVSHPIIDLARQARARLPQDCAITRVRLAVHPLVPSVMGIGDPANGLEAKFSAVHCFALGLVRASADPQDFTDEAACDPELAHIRRRTVLLPQDDLDRYTVRALIETDQGPSLELTVESARRLDTQGVREKARKLIEPVLGPGRDAFLETAFGLQEVEEAATVAHVGSTALARP